MLSYLVAGCLLIGSAKPLASQRGPTPFVVDEATIASIHSAMRDGRITARQLVESYLARIGAYDKVGPRPGRSALRKPDCVKHR